MQDYCRSFIREHDYPRYLLTFFVPRPMRPALYAILVFHAELQHIPANANEPMAAYIRLKWWNEQIDLIYDGKNPAASPILDDLKITIERYNIPQKMFKKLFTVYDNIMRGKPSDPDDALYALCGAVIKDAKSKDRFSKTLQHHDILPENTKFRALRLWLGV